MKKSIIIFLCLLSLSVGIGGFWALLESPFFGINVSEHDGNWYVDSVLLGSPAEGAQIRPGMILMTINGIKLKKYSLISDLDMIPDLANFKDCWQLQYNLGKEIKPGKEAIFSLQGSQGQQSLVSITPRSFHFFEVAERTAPLYLAALFCLAIGFAVAIKRTKDSRAELFFLLLFSVSLILFTFGSWSSRNLLGHPVLLILLSAFNLGFAFPYFPLFFFHFCLSFPEQAKILNKKGIVLAMYVLPLIVQAIYIPRLMYEIYMLYWAFGLAGGVVAMIFRYFKDKNPLHRAQIKWILWGTTIFGVGMCITYALPLLSRSYEIYSYLLPSLAFLLIPSTFAMAILRFRLLKIDDLFDATFAYTILAGLFIAFDIGVAYLLSQVITLEITGQYVLASIMTILLVMFFYVPVKGKILTWVKRIFRRDIYNAEEVVHALSNRLMTADSEEKALSIFFEALDTALHPRWIYHPEDEVVSSRAPPKRAAESLDSILKPRQFSSSMGIDTVFFHDEPPEHLSGSAVIPLRIKKNPDMMIVAGPKDSGNLYTSGDLSLLNSMSSLTVLALDELHEHEQRKRAEAERDADHIRISREIHDGIGGMLANAIMISDIVLSEPMNSQIHDRLGSIRSLLSQCLADLRAMIWALRDSDSSFLDFSSSIQSHALNMLAGHSIQLDYSATSSENGCPSLCATIRANLFRCVQEFIANSICHGMPTLIKIRLLQSAESLEIDYEENGVGFCLDGGSESGYGLNNVRARVRALNGILEIQSSPGKGFSARILTPLQIDMCNISA